MTNYTISLTAEEFDELERIVRAQYRDDGIELICRPHETKTALRKRTQIQGRIVGQIMDARRRAGEIQPRRDPENPLLPAEEENDGKTEECLSGQTGGQDTGSVRRPAAVYHPAVRGHDADRRQRGPGAGQ